jgi:hypothetical protein
MSDLVQINEYLDQTRNMSVEELNVLIRHMDQSAEPQTQQGFAHSILGYMKMSDIKGEVATFEAAKTKAEALKSRHAWLFAEPTPEVEAPVAVEVVAVPKAPKVKVEKKGDIAKRIYAGLADKSKANVMKVFQTELQTTVAGSQTYFYVCNGPTGAQRGRKASSPDAKKVAYVRKTAVGAPTKRELATKLFASAPDKSRATIVARFQTELGLTKAGSTTYYYTVGGAHLRSAKK